MSLSGRNTCAAMQGNNTCNKHSVLAADQDAIFASCWATVSTFVEVDQHAVHEYLRAAVSSAQVVTQMCCTGLTWKVTSAGAAPS